MSEALPCTPCRIVPSSTPLVTKFEKNRNQLVTKFKNRNRSTHLANRGVVISGYLKVGWTENPVGWMDIMVDSVLIGTTVDAIWNVVIHSRAASLKDGLSSGFTLRERITCS